MDDNDHQVNIHTEIWWYVALKGGLLFGILAFLPTSILVDVFLDATNGTWLHEYSSSRAKRIAQWTDVEYLAVKALYYFVVGSLCGVLWWMCHRYQMRQEISKHLK